MDEINVGLAGYMFMGRAHSNTYRQVAHSFDVDPVWDGYASLVAAEACLASLREDLSQLLPAAERPTLYGNKGLGVVR
jgi:hypothetical protein